MLIVKVSLVEQKIEDSASKFDVIVCISKILTCCILFQLAVACVKMKRPEIAENAIKVAERRIAGDKWPEYYDTKRGGFIGKQARLFQTWSIAGYLVAKLLVANPEAAKMLITIEDTELLSAFSSILSSNPRRKRSRKGAVKQSYIV